MGAFRSLTRNLALVRAMSKREIEMRYRESMLGLAWAVIAPLLILAVYAFVFGEILGARWPGRAAWGEHFAIPMFAGLSVFSFFSEVVGRSPSLIMGNANLARKIVFPLEILSWIAVVTALVGLAINVALLEIFLVAVEGRIPWTAALFPLVLLPLVMFTVGMSWFLAATGPFFRDIGQLVGLALTALLFLSPVFYPVSAVPERYRDYFQLNPLTYFVEEARRTLVTGEMIDWPRLAVFAVAGAVVMVAGHRWFMAMRRAAVDLV